MYPDNAWYSHRKILADYCNMEDKHLLGSIQHGWVHSLDYESFLIKRKFNLFCWSDYLSNFCMNKGYKKIIPIGAPFLYLCKMHKEKIKNNGSGTIVFPSHSNLEDYQSVNHKGLIDIVERKYEGPYKVHLYYTDFIEKNFYEYQKRGWEIISSEKRSSKDFLYRIFLELNNSKNVVSSDISSVFFYAMYLLKNVSLINKDRQNKDLTMIYRNQFDIFTENYIKKNYTLFDGTMSLLEKKRLANLELGEDFILPPIKLKKLLGFDSPLKNLLSKTLSKIIELKQGKSLKHGDL
jgi:hypothetical protein